VRYVALARLRNLVRVVAVNDAVLIAWFADIGFGADVKWWLSRYGVRSFPGLRVILYGNEAVGTNFGCSMVTKGPSAGFSDVPGIVATNANSGDMAIQIANQYGPKKIVLIGFDMQPAADGTRHFYGDYEDPALQSEQDMRVWLHNLRDHTAKALSGKLINCTNGGAIDFLPTATIEQAIGYV
jgi:hypothetical protein